MKNLKSILALIACLVLIGAPFSCKKSTTKPVVVTPPPANLVAYWPFSNNTNDISRYSNNGSPTNVTSVADRFGNPNSAYSFDGTTSCITVPDSIRLRLNNTDFTLNAWVKLDSYNSQYLSTIISKRFSGVNNGWIWGANGNLNSPVGAVYYGPGGGNANAVGSVVLNVAQWYMVTCVYSLANQAMSIYLNGVLNNSSDAIQTPNASIASDLYIGKDNSGSGSQYYFKGTLDDIRIYNTALDLTAIQQLYTATNSGL